VVTDGPDRRVSKPDQFFLKMIDDNAIFRQFPGMDEMEVKYLRCQI
jgi:hypothetical protein